MANKKLLGGTLQQLAEDRGTSFDELRKLNPNLDPNTTFAASEVKFSAPSVPAGVSFDPKTNISTTAPRTSGTTGLTKTPTGSTGPGGPIFDIFKDGQKLEEKDFIGLGVNVADIPIGEAPEGFKSQFLPVETEVEGGVSDTSGIRKDNDKTKSDVDKAKAGLAEFGITEPGDDEVSKTVQDILDGLKTRQTELDKRREEDLARIEKGFGTAEEELKIGQEEAFSRAEGRTRIGGFIVRTEIEDLENMQRKHRLELTSLQGQRETAISTASRAYEDQDFKLAQAQLEVAMDIENQTSDRKRTYFKDVMAMSDYYDKLNKPITEADDADKEQMLAWMKAAPSIIESLGIKNSDILLGNVKFGEVMAAYFDSPEFEKSQQGKILSPTEAGRLGVPFGTTEAQAIELGVVPKFGKGDGEDEVSDIESFALDLAANKITASNVPQNIRGRVLSRARELTKENLIAQVDTYETKEAATTDLENNRESIISQVGADGFNEIKETINTKFPEEGEEGGGGIVGAVGSFFKRLFGF